MLGLDLSSGDIHRLKITQSFAKGKKKWHSANMGNEGQHMAITRSKL